MTDISVLEEMAPRNTVIQTTLPCPPLQQEEIDQLIHGMLNVSGNPNRSITEIISVEKLFFVRNIQLIRTKMTNFQSLILLGSGPTWLLLQLKNSLK